MPRMTDREGPRPPSDTPGERRPARLLDRPPSERYRIAEPEPEPPVRGGSAGRGVALGVVVAILGAAAVTVAGGLLTITAGLLVIAAAAGWGVGLAVRLGAGDAMHRPARVRSAVLVAVLGLALGQAGLWLLARQEGGVMGPTDYLGEVFGVLVPLEALFAIVGAWWAAR
jgi:hypothetical protein